MRVDVLEITAEHDFARFLLVPTRPLFYKGVNGMESSLPERQHTICLRDSSGAVVDLGLGRGRQW